MAKKISRRLVIDASVARACGKEESKHPTGTRCREFLEAVRIISHQLVMTPDISREWGEHQSNAARKWRVQMYARKKVCWVQPEVDQRLVQTLGRVEVSESDHKAMLKDLSLIEAARATDHTVISLDEKVRGLFARASDTVTQLKRIVWANPDRSEEGVIGWLERGARPERKRMLGWQG